MPTTKLEKKGKSKSHYEFAKELSQHCGFLGTGMARRGAGVQVKQLDRSEASVLSPMMFS